MRTQKGNGEDQKGKIDGSRRRVREYNDTRENI
jgi:hypothetical protein